MVRVVVKGGVWKNTEDEILKAAISKYGKNQWARISSLLVRKTPKQCKARWYEWLDPSIKKTEWSREEDEKLLHLAKLMPTQWRTIAPIVGRTATQCLERYQRLLDEAEQRENDESASGTSKLGLSGPEGGESVPSAEDIRRLRPGEIDPDPETKPARPDAIDMDEDEKEMLSEARARLANTQGKKAKRKARERALEEARRLAVLQKRRELKAAGITSKLKAPKKGMDYMTDIPFEKQAAIGFYDTSEEASRAIRAPVGRSIGQLDNPNKIRKEDEERKRKQIELQKKKQNADGKDSVNSAKLDELRRSREQEQMAKRRRLELPDAIVGQHELDDIVKMGLASEVSRNLVDNQGPNEGLLGDYGRAPLAHVAESRSVRSERRDDNIMREALDLRRMQNMQTPLLQDSTDRDEGRDGAGETTQPASRRMLQGRATPLPLQDSVSNAGSTATPLRTPLRDNLGLNVGDTSSMFSSAPQQARRSASAAKARLQQSLMRLPAPKNDFDIVLDEDGASLPQDDEQSEAVQHNLDASEREKMAQRMKTEQAALQYARQTQVVRRSLPRPKDFTEEEERSFLEKVSAHGQTLADRSSSLIFREMLALIKHDALTLPLAGSKTIGGQPSRILEIHDSLIESARTLLEMEGARTSLGSETRSNAELMDLNGVLERKRCSSFRGEDRQSWATYVRHLQTNIGLYASDAARDEKRLAKILGGYHARSGVLAESIRKEHDELKRLALEEEVFSRLYNLERVTKADRQDQWQRCIQILEQREREGQSIYKELDEERSRQQAELTRSRSA